NAKGPPALSGPMRTCQRPRSSATARAVRPLKVTVTRSPGAAQPQMRSFWPCCNTMLSPMIEGTRTSAQTCCANADVSVRLKASRKNLEARLMVFHLEMGAAETTARRLLKSELRSQAADQDLEVARLKRGFVVRA